jgi:SAM-dependent methyltransferase
VSASLLPARVPLRRRLGLLADAVRLRRPPVAWGPGYWEFRNAAVAHVLGDPAALEWFDRPGRLPVGFGVGLDERIVEYPWVFRRLNPRGAVLDAGSTLNVPGVLRRLEGRVERLLIFSLAVDEHHPQPWLGYALGDLRAAPFSDATFSQVVCISTLEHVGLDNALYTGGRSHREARPTDFRRAVTEMRRVLRPGGELLLTVPYGRYDNFGWMQQFDAPLLAEAVAAFAGDLLEEHYFHYTRWGWQWSTAEACATREYHDVRRHRTPAADSAAAGRGVALLRLRRPAEVAA